MIDSAPPFAAQFAAGLERISPAERRVARFFEAHPEEVLVASASALAARIGTSDATVVRTAKALGFAGMEELRRSLVRGLRASPSPADRLTRTLEDVSDRPEGPLAMVLETHRQSLEALRRDISPAQFDSAVRSIATARRVVPFGLGPSSAMADYLAIQLERFGIEALSLTQSGLLLADGARKLRQDDLLILFAYGRVYRELTVLLNQAKRCGAGSILVSDTLGARLRRRAATSGVARRLNLPRARRASCSAR